MQVVFSHAERKGGKDFRYLQIDKDGYTIPVITVLVLGEGMRDGGTPAPSISERNTLRITWSFFQSTVSPPSASLT